MLTHHSSGFPPVRIIVLPSDKLLFEAGIEELHCRRLGLPGLAQRLPYSQYCLALSSHCTERLLAGLPEGLRYAINVSLMTQLDQSQGIVLPLGKLW